MVSITNRSKDDSLKDSFEVINKKVIVKDNLDITVIPISNDTKNYFEKPEKRKEAFEEWLQSKMKNKVLVTFSEFGMKKSLPNLALENFMSLRFYSTG